MRFGRWNLCCCGCTFSEVRFVFAGTERTPSTQHIAVYNQTLLRVLTKVNTWSRHQTPPTLLLSHFYFKNICTVWWWFAFSSSHYKIIKYSAIEKFLFAKNYLYLVMIQNTTFIKFWVYEILHEYNKSKTIYIVTSIVAIILILLYIYMKSVE